MAKKLISEQEILAASKRGENVVTYDAGVIITAAARDRARQLGIKLVQKNADQPVVVPAAGSTNRPSSSGEKIAIGSDHGGFSLKESLKPYIQQLGYTVVDVGTYSEEACDYPDFAYAVSRMVMLGDAAKGIMIDAIGIASAMVANKLSGIRAACCTDEFSARSSREHNNANVLTLGGRVLGVELAKAIVNAWLSTNFGGGRHQKRIDKIREIETRMKKIE